MTLDVPGGTTAEYDRTDEILRIAGDGDAPPGLVVYNCGATDDGLFVADVWDAGDGMPAMQPRFIPIYERLQPAG